MLMLARSSGSFRVTLQAITNARFFAVTGAPLPPFNAFTPVTLAVVVTILAVAVPVWSAGEVSSWHVREHNQGRRPFLSGTGSDILALPTAFNLPHVARGYRHATTAFQWHGVCATVTMIR